MIELKQVTKATLNDYVRCQLSTSDYIVLAGSGGDAKAFEHGTRLASGEVKESYRWECLHKGGVFRIVVLNDQSFASVGADGFVRKWCLRSGEQLAERMISKSWVEQLAFSEFHGLMAVSSQKKLYFLDLDLKIIGDQEKPKSILALESSHNGKVFWLSYFGAIERVDPTGELKEKKYEVSAAMSLLRPSYDGRFLAATANDPSVMLWNLKSGESMRMAGFETKVRDFQWSKNSGWALSASGMDLTLWDTTGKDGPAGKTPKFFSWHSSDVSSLCLIQNGKYFASASADGAVFVWDEDRNDPIAFHMHNDEITSLQFCEKSSVLSFGSRNGECGLTSLAWILDPTKEKIGQERE